ncbi:hypothetical protein SSX86_028323 [Deinandra increscens subsp. villosa]|uniref:Dof zinc finger protein n=1 Tax=Deinandra increscens subsp. villosa TaxID=3103831 RepID=A0AAP0CCX8_9ASTR
MMEKEAGNQPNHPRAPPPFPPPKCPRCYSSNTKFCYYNNYSVSQPRYLCKECRRYWTHGGVLRNIPCGGTTRKRGRVDCASSSSQITTPPPPPPPPTMQSFNYGVNVAFGVGATPQPAPSAMMLPQLSSLNGFGEFGIPFVQRRLPPPQPPQLPTMWVSQNMGLNRTRSNDFLDTTTGANVVSINEWSELNDMENEGGPFQGYKPPSP